MIIKSILFVSILVIAIIGGFILWQTFSNQTRNTDNKGYRAVENKIIVFDKQNKRELSAIDLSAKEGDFTIKFFPHDITMTPDKKYVWVTVTASQEQLQEMNNALLENAEGDHHIMMATDQIIVINAVTDKIVKRIQIGVNLGLTDLIFTTDAKYAYIAAETGNAIYKVNTISYKVELIQLPPASSPHELALSNDESKLYTRNATKSKTFLVATKTNEVILMRDRNGVNNLNWSSRSTTNRGIQTEIDKVLK